MKKTKKAIQRIATQIRRICAIAIIPIIALTFTACDENGVNGTSGGDTATFTMTGKYNTPIGSIGGDYYYGFTNYSTSQVTVTLNGVTKTMTPYATLTGFYDSVGYNTRSSTATVTYSPANKIRREGTSEINFYNK